MLTDLPLPKRRPRLLDPSRKLLPERERRRAEKKPMARDARERRLGRLLPTAASRNEP